MDTDRLIEEAYRRETGQQETCRQIYYKRGKAFFRSLEKQQIISLIREQECVIAVGGGAIEDEDNVQHLRFIGEVIYLKTSVDCVWKRVERDGIPAYLNLNNPKEAFYETARRRLPLYEKAAHFMLEVEGKTAQEITELILTRATTHGK
jgi:shikimate kinase